jgi:hypothetical protein
MVIYSFLFMNVLYHDEKRHSSKKKTPFYKGVIILFKNASNKGLGLSGRDKNSG